jgi:Tfp pilus assembly protein FimV
LGGGGTRQALEHIYLGVKNMKQQLNALSLVIRAACLASLLCGVSHAQEPGSLEMITLSDQGLMPSDAKKETKTAPAVKGSVSAAQKLDVVHANFAAHVGKPHTASTAPKVAGGVVGTYQVRAGDSLDKVVQKVWPDSLLKAEVLKQSIIDMNPNAMTRGTPKMLMAGVTLNLPNEKEIIEARTSKKESVHSQEDLKGYTSYPDQALNTEGAEKRRHWVTYP